MSPSRIAIPLALALSALSARAETPATEATPTIQTLVYACDDGKKIVTVIDATDAGKPSITLSVEGDAKLQNIAMHDVISANGNKTTNGKLVWWTKGDEGFLAEEDAPKGNGEVLIGGCEEVAGDDAAATGAQYDAELAARLGGDERGMKNYVLVILKSGPNDAKFKDQARADIFAGHMSNIGRLADAGMLAVAGPFRKNDQNRRGLYIFNVETVAEAEELVLSDPAVTSGVFIAEMTPWYGSASLMATPDIHKKISKPAM